MTGRSFTASPNALFETRVAAVAILSPGFVRLTLAGPQLAHFAPRGLDLRIKVLVPRDRYPDVFAPQPEPVPESGWRACWRSLPAADRPVLRTYTPSATRPEQQELDLDVFLHSPVGPASAWAAAARTGERVLVSGPDARRGRPAHGVQWKPGAAANVVLAGDEAALPALRGILGTLGPEVRGHAFLEVDDPANAVLPAPHPDVTVSVCVRGDRTLHTALAGWSRGHGDAAAAQQEGFYAWLATESTQAAGLRMLLRDTGIPPDRIQAQGYWTSSTRASTAPIAEDCV